MALKIDYIDDQLDESMNGRKQFNMITNDNGTVSFEDKTIYIQQGDIILANTINEVNKFINEIDSRQCVYVSNKSEFPLVGNEKILYVDNSNNKKFIFYCWDGENYVPTGGNTYIITSDTQPDFQVSGDIWYQII